MWTISKEKSWDHLVKFEWVRDMEGIPQSPVHHAEGDVSTHIRMVLSVLEKLPEFRTLDAQRQEILWAAALLNDVEKRSCTFTDESGAIVSPGHARKGAMTSRQILYREIETPFDIREQIVGLVRYHGLPLWIFEKERPLQDLYKASLATDTELLVLLAKADVLGRICNDSEELLYRVEMFRELCIEQDCFGKPRHFPNKSGKFLFFRKDDASADYIPYESEKPEVILLSGIAGSGKDHYLKKHFAGMEVISLDDMRRSMKIAYNDSKGNGRIIQEAKQRARSYLRQGKSFVWNATNITTQMRSQLTDLFSLYDARVRIVYLEVPYGMLISQNRNRDFPIPENAVERMIDKLEVPEAWEAHRVEHVVKGIPNDRAKQS